jgi:hypothetical protein
MAGFGKHMKQKNRNKMEERELFTMIAADCIGGGKTLGSLEGAEEVIL